VERIRTLTADARARLQADDGPFLALQQTATAARGVAAAVNTASRIGVQLLQSMFASRTAQPFANLPVPEGQRRLALVEDLNTTIDLQTLPSARHPDDRIEVRYTVYERDQNIIRWQDEFELQSYGATGRAMASLSFAQRDGGSTWQPLPTLNWIVRYRRWPGDDNSGLRRPLLSHVGAGFSTMSLDFGDDDNVELGVAITVSLFNDWMLAGRGWNLQVNDRRGFWFFALRLFSAPGTVGRF
jgi:hypothetical protein